MRASGVMACVAFGALAVGFGAGWMARGLRRAPASNDDIAADAPPRKPATSASTVATTVVATASAPKPPPTPWTYPSSLPPGLCDGPKPFAWPTISPPKEGIARVDATHYVVGSGFVDHLLENQAEMTKAARIIPVQQDGETVGIKMFGIKPPSVLASMGFENCDLLVCLNTFPMSSPEPALEAYAKLRSMNDVAVAIVRDGKGVVLQYHVAGGGKSDLENPYNSAN